jgi:hypothetical protein
VADQTAQLTGGGAEESVARVGIESDDEPGRAFVEARCNEQASVLLGGDVGEGDLATDRRSDRVSQLLLVPGDVTREFVGPAGRGVVDQGDRRGFGVVASARAGDATVADTGRDVHDRLLPLMEWIGANADRILSTQG